MNVLYVTNLPAPYRVDFFNELGKQVNLTVLYERKTASDRDIRWKGESAQTFREVFLNGARVGAASGASHKVLSYIKDTSYDIRIMGGYASPTAMLAIRYMKRKKIPYILSIDGGFPAKETLWKRSMKRSFISGAAMYLSTGTNGDRYLMHYGADPKCIHRYHFAPLFQKDVLTAPVSAEDKEALRQKLRITKPHMILSVGRLLSLKRYDLLMEAVSGMEDAEALIVGGLPDDYHKQLLQNYPDAHVRFVDFMTYDALKEYYQAADLFVMTSDSDVWGLVLAEAMANGLPVIATDSCGGAFDLIENGKNGYVIPKGDGKALQKQIKASLPEREAFGKHSIEIVKEYTIEHEVLDHISAFHAFLRG